MWSVWGRGARKKLWARGPCLPWSSGPSTSPLAAMEDYSSQWHRYRVLNRLGFVAFAAFLCAVPGALVIAQLAHLPSDSAKTLSISFGVTALLLLWVVLNLITFWRCPRCHMWFSRRGVFGWPSLRRQCVHCGLRLYSGGSHDG